MYVYSYVTLFYLITFKSIILCDENGALSYPEKSLATDSTRTISGRRQLAALPSALGQRDPCPPQRVLRSMIDEGKEKILWRFQLKLGQLWLPIAAPEAIFSLTLKLDSPLNSILFLPPPFHRLGFQEHFIIYVSPTNLQLNICFPENLAYNDFPHTS